MEIRKIPIKKLREILRDTRRSFGPNSQSVKILERELERRRGLPKRKTKTPREKYLEGCLLHIKEVVYPGTNLAEVVIPAWLRKRSFK